MEGESPGSDPVTRAGDRDPAALDDTVASSDPAMLDTIARAPDEFRRARVSVLLGVRGLSSIL